MKKPIAFKLKDENELEMYNIQIEPVQANTHISGSAKPAVIVVRKALSLPDIRAGIIDQTDIISATDGDWSNAILLIAPPDHQSDRPTATDTHPHNMSGDNQFIKSIPHTETSLVNLGKKVLHLVRNAGLEGELIEKTKGRWVNHPTNSFTLKLQPRKKNFQFTIYGNPETYEHDGFLKKDQNSYSRGWINTLEDAEKFSHLAKISYDRRQGS